MGPVMAERLKPMDAVDMIAAIVTIDANVCD